MDDAVECPLPSGWSTGHGKTDTLCGPQSEKAHEVPWSSLRAFDAVQVATLPGCSKRRDAQRTYGVSANLTQLWLKQFDRGELNDEETEASVTAEYKAQIAALERKVGQLGRIHIHWITA